MKTEAKVGLFVAIGLIFLFLLSTQVNKFQGFGKKGYDVQAVINDASGLEPHAKVRMKGVEIGYVKKISLSGTKVVVTLFIYPGSAHEYLKREGKLTKQKAMASMDEMASSMAEAADELRGFISEMRQTLDAGSREHLKKTFSNLDTLTADLKELIADNKEGVDSLVEKINDAAEKFAQMSSKFSTSADTINSDLPDIMAKLEDTLDSFKGVGGTLNDRLPALADKFESLEDRLSGLIDENRKPLQ